LHDFDFEGAPLFVLLRLVIVKRPITAAVARRRERGSVV
jgi:hypothetical protein